MTHQVSLPSWRIEKLGNFSCKQSLVSRRVGAWIGRWLRLLARLAYQWTRAEAGMPSLAIRLSTLHR